MKDSYCIAEILDFLLCFFVRWSWCGDSFIVFPMMMQLQSKRIMAGSPFDFHRAEPSQQPVMTIPPLDVHRAESSRQHVRALNTQFARSLFYSP